MIHEKPQVPLRASRFALPGAELSCPFRAYLRIFSSCGFFLCTCGSSPLYLWILPPYLRIFSSIPVDSSSVLVDSSSCRSRSQFLPCKGEVPRRGGGGNPRTKGAIQAQEEVITGIRTVITGTRTVIAGTRVGAGLAAARISPADNHILFFIRSLLLFHQVIISIPSGYRFHSM